jgi:flagellar biosynthesis protein FlhA
VDDVLPVLTLEPNLEHSLLEQVRTGETGSAIIIDSAHAERVLDDLQRLLGAAEALGKAPVLVCSAPLRAALHRLINPALPRLAVLAYGEVGGHFAIETLGMVNDVRAAAA